LPDVTSVIGVKRQSPVDLQQQEDTLVQQPLREIGSPRLATGLVPVAETSISLAARPAIAVKRRVLSRPIPTQWIWLLLAAVRMLEELVVEVEEEEEEVEEEQIVRDLETETETDEIVTIGSESIEETNETIGAMIAETIVVIGHEVDIDRECGCFRSI